MIARKTFSLAITLAVAFAIGCGGTPNAEPPDAQRPDGGGRDAYVPPPDTGGSDAGIDAASDVDAFREDSGADAGDEDAAVICDDPSGCYACAPTTDEQFLNHCTAAGVDCEPFPVTVARLPRLRADGTVPPLP